jgi:hypothetical protein
MQVDYSTIATTVLEQLLEKGFVIAGIAAEDLFCPQEGLRLMTESARDPRIRGLIIFLCANHMLDLVLRKTTEGSEEFAVHLKSITVFQGILRKNAAIRQYGKV